MSQTNGAAADDQAAARQAPGERRVPDFTTSRALTKVPEIALMFWAMKLLTTGMGEAMSDFLGSHSVPIAGIVGFGGLLLALWLQLRHDGYSAPRYWFVVMMVAVFGTMIADGIHDGAGIGYGITTPLFAVLTALVFVLWYRSEGTLSIHLIDTRKREIYYWCAVLATFSLGTAAGDLTATEFGMGYWPSALLFAVLIAIPAVGWARWHWGSVFSFWFAYIVTRPLGASFADGFSKPDGGGLNLGDGLVAGIALVIFIGLVSWVAITKRDTPRAQRRGGVAGAAAPANAAASAVPAASEFAAEPD
jgi:uncharacterized membrane-anchored protein